MCGSCKICCGWLFWVYGRVKERNLYTLSYGGLDGLDILVGFTQHSSHSFYAVFLGFQPPSSFIRHEICFSVCFVPSDFFFIDKKINIIKEILQEYRNRIKKS